MVIGTNPPIPGFDQNRFRELARKLDFLVVQDMFTNTETAQRADLVFPAAGWGEKEGTFINSERRIGTVKKVARAPGQALSDFNIFRSSPIIGAARSLRPTGLPRKPSFRSSRNAPAGQPCDISGIRDYRMIDECGGIQWPWPSTNRRYQRRLSARPHPSGGCSQAVNSFTRTNAPGLLWRPPGHCPNRPMRSILCCC